MILENKIYIYTQPNKVRRLIYVTQVMGDNRGYCVCARQVNDNKTLGLVEMFTDLALQNFELVEAGKVIISVPAAIDQVINRRYNVFVYGSLLSGLHNHRVMIDANGKFKGNDSIRAQMFTSNESWPFLQFSQSNKHRVIGEIYSVDKKGLQRLDGLEGYRPGTNSCLFYRKIATTKNHGQTFVYIGGEALQGEHNHKRHVSSGDWRKDLTERKSQ